MMFVSERFIGLISVRLTPFPPVFRASHLTLATQVPVEAQLFKLLQGSLKSTIGTMGSIMWSNSTLPPVTCKSNVSWLPGRFVKSILL